jgi:hypothetical protein
LIFTQELEQMDFLDTEFSYRLFLAVGAFFVIASVVLIRFFNRRFEEANRIEDAKSAHFLTEVLAEQERHAMLYSEHQSIDRRKVFDGELDICPEVARLLAESAEKSSTASMSAPVRTPQ